jgi:cadmium resistance protein CadD (predicted permease)
MKLKSRKNNFSNILGQYFTIGAWIAVLASVLCATLTHFVPANFS